MFSMTATEASGQRNPVHAGTPSPFNGLDGRTEMINSEKHAPKDKTNKSVIRLAGLRLMLVESDAQKALDAIEAGRIDLARVYLSGVIDNMKMVYLKDVEQ